MCLIATTSASEINSGKMWRPSMRLFADSHIATGQTSAIIKNISYSDGVKQLRVLDVLI